MTHDVAALCESLGHEVTEAAPDADLAEVTQVFLEFAAAAVRQMVRGVQRQTGRPVNEETLFSLSGQLERARPWAHRRPAVHVAG